MKPLAIDLYCGLGGWTEGLLLEGYEVVGFDIERHVYGDHRYPSQLVLQDVRTLHGRQFKDAALIVGSSPCQEFSYRAMPWKRAKALPPPVLGIELFQAQFRIQREASVAAGVHIPMVVENVRAAQKWVGPARWHFGSFYLWGDIPALMPMVRQRSKIHGHDWNQFKRDGKVSPAWTDAALKSGGSWFGMRDGQRIERRDPREVKRRPGEDAWFSESHNSYQSRRGGRRRRRAASTLIAKIPLPLARHIARTYLP